MCLYACLLTFLFTQIVQNLFRRLLGCSAFLLHLFELVSRNEFERRRVDAIPLEGCVCGSGLRCDVRGCVGACVRA